jgi:hypothetical protein
MQDDHEFDAHRLELAHLEPERRQTENRLVGLEKLARVRLEGQHAMGHAELLGNPRGLADHGLVATMDAVEIAERDHGAAGLDRHFLVMAKDPHRLCGPVGRMPGGPSFPAVHSLPGERAAPGPPDHNATT